MGLLPGLCSLQALIKTRAVQGPRQKPRLGKSPEPHEASLRPRGAPLLQEKHSKPNPIVQTRACVQKVSYCARTQDVKTWITASVYMREDNVVEPAGPQDTLSPSYLMLEHNYTRFMQGLCSEILRIQMHWGSPPHECVATCTAT